MNQFVEMTPNGNFALEGKRWFCNSAVYFGRYPGAMLDWISDDEIWAKNQPRLEGDFGRMRTLGLNHAPIFLKSEMFFDAGKPIARGYDRLDRVIETAKRNDIRVTLFVGGFIDTPQAFHRVTGKQWKDGNRWLASFNEEVFGACVQQVRPLVERYRNEPAVLGHADRIDRFFNGFDNVTVPHNLKEEWAAWLKSRYGSIKNLIEAKGGSIEGNPQEFDEVPLPQQSRFNASLRNPLAYDYILWQKKTIGETQSRWDAIMLQIAPRQIFWTPFEGCTLDWAMLDGFSPETRRLQAIWMEYYHWQAVRTLPVGPYDEWAHTREFVTQRLHHESPTIFNTAYLTARYVKLSTQRPTVVCHGARVDAPTLGVETEAQQAAMIDRVNAACLAADADGWHYWCLADDWESSLSHHREQKADPTAMYWQGESMGLFDYDDHPRPSATVACEYSSQLRRRSRQTPADAPPRTGQALLLSSAPRMYSLFRRMATPTAAAVNGAMLRLGVSADYLWTAQNDDRITDATLARYRLIVIADNVYGRDFADIPDKLLRFVEAGGTLYLPLDQWETQEDQHGVRRANPAIKRLSGVDPAGPRDWPGANEACRNWPFPGTAPHEPNFDAAAFPRVHWGICPEFRHRSCAAQRLQMLGFRPSDDGDAFTVVPALVPGAQVIAVAKSSGGTKPFVWRHALGKGHVYVNAWTNNVFRDADRRTDYGGWDYDWLLSLPIETADLTDANIIDGPGLWLRNSWGYFWKDR